MGKEKTKESRSLLKQKRLVSHRKHQFAYKASMEAMGVKPVPGWETMSDEMMEKEVDKAFMSIPNWKKRRALLRMGVDRKTVREQMKTIKKLKHAKYTGGKTVKINKPVEPKKEYVKEGR